MISSHDGTDERLDRPPAARLVGLAAFVASSAGWREGSPAAPGSSALRALSRPAPSRPPGTEAPWAGGTEAPGTCAGGA